MISKDQFKRLLPPFLIFAEAGEDLHRAIQENAIFRCIPAGADVFVEGDQADPIALLFSGVVRVYMIGESGHEITLCRFGHGESCILTVNTIPSQKTFPAITTVEEQAEAVLIPADIFRDWVRRHDLLQEFVSDLLSDRLTAMMTISEEVAFKRMDRRLATFLLERAQHQNPIAITHREIATELGTSREVISRLIEDLALEMILLPGRGRIEINSPQTLERRAKMRLCHRQVGHRP